METLLTKEQGRRIAEIIGGAQGCGAIWNVIMGDLDNPYCDGFVIGGHNKEGADEQPSKRTSRGYRTMKPFLISLLLAFALGCAPTYAPKAPMSATASWDGSAQNSGFVVFDAAGNGILTPHAKDRYVGLVTIYGNRFNPPLEPTAGLTLTATNTFIIDGQHLAYFATMNRWKKEGK